MAIENVADRAAGYGMPGVTVDGGDPVAVYTVAREAVDRARAGGGPTLIEAKVQRLTAHSSDDDDRTYRDPEELKAERAQDPIVRFRAALMEQGVLTEAQDADIRARIKAQIDDATEFAEQAPYPDPAELMLHVYGS